MENLLSINDCYQLWKESNQNHLSPSTYHRYSNIIEKHLLLYFADIKLQSITKKDIELFFEKKTKEGMSEVTMNMLLMLLKNLLHIAGTDTVRLGLERTVHIRHSKRLVEIMQKEEWERLDVILSNNETLKYLAICLAFKMGLTVGEICALMWEEVDFDRKMLSVKCMVQRLLNTEEQGNKTVLAKQPLTDTARRELPIPESVFKILVRYKKSNGYILECKEGKIPDPRREQLRLEKIFKRQEMKEYGFYTLRDTFAVRCIRAGINVEDLSYVLGHASVTVTAQRYKEFLEVKQDRLVVLKRYLEMV